MFDKKTIIAFVLIAIIFIGWQYFWVETNPPQKPPQTTTIDSVTSKPAATEQKQTQPTTTEQKQAQPEAALVDTVAALPDTIPEQLINVETDRYWITLSNKGGGLISLQLKDHHYADNGGIYLLADDNTQATPSLISKSNDFTDVGQIYSTDADDVTLTGSRDSAIVTYSTVLPGGSTLNKEFVFFGDRYDFGLTIALDDVPNSGMLNDYVLAWLPGIPPSERDLKNDYGSYRGGAYLAGKMYKFDSFDDNDRLLEDQSGNAEWVGSRSKYFAYALIPQSKMSAGAYITGTETEVNTPEGKYDQRVISAGIVMPVTGETAITDRFLVYAGPLDLQVLRTYNENLEDFIDWGWAIIKPFSIAVYWVVYFVHKFIPNYGVVIMVVAILLKLLTYPLTKKQLKSMRAMQALQPKMEELKVKFKENPQKLNQAMMKLYKDEKVNPFGSCLYMLPQMPLLYGLYQVFRSTFELRQAYFLPWWPDLSQPDVFPYPLPIIMAVAMFFQQKLAMTDPKHKMMIYLMPIMFFFFFKGLPTGLVLYWTFFSVLSVVEALTVKKSFYSPGQTE